MILSDDDRAYLHTRLGLASTAEILEKSGFPLGTPDERARIRNGPTDCQFWKERHLTGPFRPEPIAPQEFGDRPTAGRKDCADEIARRQRLRAIWAKAKVDAIGIATVDNSAPDNRTPIERVRVNAQAYATGNSSRDNYSADDHAAYLANERAEHERLYAQRAKRQANA